jgi:hypothetical protein
VIKILLNRTISIGLLLIIEICLLITSAFSQEGPKPWRGVCVKLNMQNFSNKIFSDYYGKSVIGAGAELILLRKTGFALTFGIDGTEDNFNIYNSELDLSQEETMNITTFNAGIRKYSQSGFYLGGGISISSVEAEGVIWNYQNTFEYQTKDEGKGIFGVIGLTVGKVMRDGKIDIQAKFTNIKLKKTKEDFSNIILSIGILFNM